MKHVVMYSGGVGSWAAAKRVAQQHGTEDMTLLFTDTKVEDRDLYRFLHEGAKNIGARVEMIADGRTPWQVFNDVKLMGNTRQTPCARVLKQEQAKKWIRKQTEPLTIYIGIDWTETHRTAPIVRNWAPIPVEFPMMEPPYLAKDQVLGWLKDEGIEPPRLYAQGFPHNNCGGACVKAGAAQWKLLYEKNPELYAHHETQEQEFRVRAGRDVSILRDRIGGPVKPLTLRRLREERLESPEGLGQMAFDWGGCGCFSEEDSENGP